MSAEATTRPAGRTAVRLRRAAPTDLAAIRRLAADLGYHHRAGELSADFLARALGRPDVVVSVAVLPDGCPAGLLALSCRPHLHLGGNVVSVDTLVVSAEARGQGIGRRLLRRVRAYARATGAIRVELHTNRGRESYRRGFYTAAGYREAGSALFRLADLEGDLTPTLGVGEQ